MNKSVEDVDDFFYNDRLDRDWLNVTDYPARIDQAAMDLLHGISVGKSSSGGRRKFVTSGDIGTFEFGRATGGFYKEGLTALSGSHSDLPTVIREYRDTDIGDLAFRFNELQYKLRKLERHSSTAQIDDMNRVLEKIIEKVLTRSIRGADEIHGQTTLQSPESVIDLMHQLFSDPSTTEYAAELINTMSSTPGGEDLLALLDSPEMVTPLWTHQREAIETWLEHGSKGYVDMATATGKTVLGLAAIATRYGALHPQDEAEIDVPSVEGVDNGRVLIVAGQDLLLEQWRSEFDEHLNIPRDRTGTGESVDHIELEWGRVEFKPAQELIAMDSVGSYDLVILDEAHQYSRGSRTGRGWRDVFEDLVEHSRAILAMSGSVDQGWLGDEGVENALKAHLSRCKRFSVPEAREAGVIADFRWEVQYAGADQSDSHAELEAKTARLQAIYDGTNHKFDVTRADDSLATKVDSPFETLTDLRSFSQSKAGRSLRESSTTFDQLANAAFSRRPQRWALSPAPETIADLIVSHAPDEQVIVLVQSYAQAEQVGDVVKDRLSEGTVLVPDADASNQFDTIEEFKEGDHSVIIGPGNVLGTGVDLPEADVAINIAKGGVNASLIQRIGRILRNPSGDKRATFYQIVTLPSTDGAHLYGEDGRRLLRRASEFRALGARLRELPAMTTADVQIAATLSQLESAGADAMRADGRPMGDIVGDDVARVYLEDLLRNVDADGDGPTLPWLWIHETIPREAEPLKDLAK